MAEAKEILEKLFSGSQLRGFLMSRPGVKDADILKDTLEKLILLRVVVLTAMLGASAWQVLDRGAVSNDPLPYFWSFGLIYLVSLGNAFWLRHTSDIKAFGYLQLLTDVLLATVAIHVGDSIAFISLYLLIIVAAALVISKHGAIAIAAFCGICYGLLASGLLGETNLSASTAEILGVYVSLVAIAVISGYSAGQIEIIRTIADRRSKSLDELHAQKDQFFNDVSDGVITLDLSSTVTGINEAARAIVGLAKVDPHDLVGVSLQKALNNHGISGAEEFVDSTKASENDGEITMLVGEPARDVHINYSVKTIRDSTGTPTGKMLIFNDISHVKNIQERLELHERMAKLLSDAGSDVETQTPLIRNEQLLGESEVMKKVFALVERVASSDVSVLITGESGVGKEVIAKTIHLNSSRDSAPFVAINCGAIPENLIESELFGHKKGAFTGAVSGSQGLFRQAEGGTVFLDEIGDLPLHLQTKLLRVLQEKRVRPVGESVDIPVNVRILAATNRDLKSEMSRGNFREDLFYRLNVVNIFLPPLRERKEDIPLLVRHFVSIMNSDEKQLPEISPDALHLLSQYSFPGNIRELENIINRALVLGGHAILPEHLPEEVLTDKARDPFVLETAEQEHCHPSKEVETEILSLPIDLEEALARLERTYLSEALKKSEGVKKQAAELLGLNFRSFRYRLKKYDLGENNSK